MRHSTEKISAAEFSAHPVEYLEKVRRGGETIVITENNCPVAELRSSLEKHCTLEQFCEMWHDKAPDPDLAGDLETVDQADQPLVNPWD